MIKEQAPWAMKKAHSFYIIKIDFGSNLIVYYSLKILPMQLFTSNLSIQQNIVESYLLKLDISSLEMMSYDIM